MAVQLYFGAPGSGYWNNPHAPELLNPAIVPPTDTLQRGVAVQISTTLQNHGNDPCMDAIVRLYWADPATAYLPSRCCRIKEFNPGIVPANSDVWPIGTPLTQTVSWAPTVCMLGTNNGCIALLAQAYSLSANQFPSGPTQTDPLSAVHNVQVVETLSAASAPATVTRAMKGIKRKEVPGEVHFAFAATNPLNTTLQTEVVAQDLSLPKRNADLCAALHSPKLSKLTCCSKTESVEPAGVHLHLGIERVMARYFDSGRPGIDEFTYQGTRIGHTGPVTPDIFDRICVTSKEETPSKFELRPFESRQVILGVVPKGKQGDVHTIEVVHRTVKEKGKEQQELGRIVVIFVVGKGFEG